LLLEQSQLEIGQLRQQLETLRYGVRFDVISFSTASLSPRASIDSRSQEANVDTEKLTKMNSKLKQVVQRLKEKMQRVVNESPSLFEGVGEETNERLDHVLALVGEQARRIDELQSLQKESVNDSDTHPLAHSGEEYVILRQRLEEVEDELRKVTEDRTAVLGMYEEQFNALMQERDALVEQSTQESLAKYGCLEKHRG
jgi:hypothetical protein